MKFLVDTNVWLEILLAQERAGEAQSFLNAFETSEFALTEFSLYSLGVILTRLQKADAFAEYLADVIDRGQVACIRLQPSSLRQVLVIQKQFQLDFDDAYQYAVAEEHDLVIVSFDRGFDKTTRGRKEPAAVVRM